MSDAWEEIQAVKSKRNSLREKLEKRKKERQNILGATLPSGDKNEIASSTASGGKERSVSSPAPAKSDTPPIEKSKVVPSASLEVRLLQVLSDMQLQLPATAIALMPGLGDVDTEIVASLLQKFATQKLITIKERTENTTDASIEVVSAESVRLAAVLAALMEEQPSAVKRKGDCIQYSQEGSNPKVTKSTTDEKKSGKGDTDIMSLIAMPSSREKAVKRVGEEIMDLLSKPTAKEKSLADKFKSQGGAQVMEFCPHGTRVDCGSTACKKLHFKKIIQSHTDESLGDCSFLNTCFHMDSCKYVHYEVDNADPNVAASKVAPEPITKPGHNVNMNRTKASVAQLTYLSEHMKKNIDMSTGHLRHTLQERADLENQWEELAKKLNCLGGPIKTTSKWKQAWRDLKNNVKKKAAQNKSEFQGDGSGRIDHGSSDIKAISAVEDHVTLVMDPVAVLEMEGVSITEPIIQLSESPVRSQTSLEKPLQQDTETIEAPLSPLLLSEPRTSKKRQSRTKTRKRTIKEGTPSAAKPDGVLTLTPPQWIQCDLRYLDMTFLGKFAVIMADPPWDIHMELPYGTMSDDEMRCLGVPQLQDSGLIFLWVTGRAMELGRECLKLWGYERVDELIWVKTNQLQRIIRTGRTGHWLNHGKEHCLVGMKGNPENLNRGLDCDVIVAEVRATSHKPDEIYGIIERLSPGTRKIELFGRPHNVQPNWITLGNQVDGVRLVDPELIAAFKKRYPDGNCMAPPPPDPGLS